jgi:hypothetical protein
MKALLLLLLVSATALADEDDAPISPPEEQRIYLGIEHFSDPLFVGNTTNAYVGGLGYRTARNFFCAGADGHGGVGSDGGFVYRAEAFVGFGGRAGPFLLCALGGGQVSGITSDRIPFGVSIPVEAYALATLDEHWGVAIWGRPSWFVKGDARKDGSKMGLGDEIEIGGNVHFMMGGGQLRDLLVGFSYDELMHTKALFFTFGLGRWQR